MREENTSLKKNDPVNRGVKRTFFYFAMIIIVCIILLPVFTMISTAFKPSAEIYSSSNFLPQNPTLDHYQTVSKFRGGIFFLGIKNSLVVCFMVVIIQSFVVSLAGYAIVRFSSLFTRIYSSMLLLLYILPNTLALIPLFVFFKRINVIETHNSLFLAYMMMTMPFAIWMFKAFIASLPYSLEEAAMIDGCSVMGAYFRIVLPLTTPGIVAISVNSFLVCWSEYLMSSVFVKTEKLRTVTVMLQFFREESYSEWGALLAAACIASIPALFILLFGQKYIISGIAAGAVKE